MKTFTPYDYQQDAIRASLAAYQEGRRQHVLEIPTGGGKTLISGEILRQMLTKQGMRALITVPFLDLVEQTYQKYTDFFFSPYDLGIVQGTTRQWGRQVTIASVDTLSRSEHLERFQTHLANQPLHCVIFDECHRSLATKYARIKEQLAGPETLLVGMSATPYRADNRSLASVFPDEMAYSIDFLELIARGRLSDIWPHNIVTNLDLSQIDVEGLYEDTDDLPKGVLERLQQSNRHAQAYEAWMHFTGGTKRTIVFAQDIDDAYAFQRYIQARGKECEVVTGQFSKERRNEIYARFKTGTLPMLVNYNVLSTGIDFPFVECIIIMRSMNQGLWTQAVGRGLRLCPDIGKIGCYLLNLVDQQHTLMTMNKLIGTTDTNHIPSVRQALREKLEKEETEAKEATQLSITVRLQEVQARSYDLFAGEGWKRDPITGSFFKDVGTFGMLYAERTFTGYQVYLRRKSGRRQWIMQTAQDGKTACRLANLHLERLKVEQQKRKGDHPDLANPITESHWNYLKQRRVGCIGASWRDAVGQGMKESHYYPLETRLRVQKVAFGKGQVIRGPLAPLKKTTKKRENLP